jgi:tRNA A37 threonylcarbamoyladenosine dehydratase
MHSVAVAGIGGNGSIRKRCFRRGIARIVLVNLSLF